MWNEQGMKGPVVGPGGRVTALTLLDPSTPPGAPSARRALEQQSKEEVWQSPQSS